MVAFNDRRKPEQLSLFPKESVPSLRPGEVINQKYKDMDRQQQAREHSVAFLLHRTTGAPYEEVLAEQDRRRGALGSPR